MSVYCCDIVLELVKRLHWGKLCKGYHFLQLHANLRLSQNKKYNLKKCGCSLSLYKSVGEMAVVQFTGLYEGEDFM